MVLAASWRVVALEPLICERQLLNGNIVARGIEIGRLQLDWKRSPKHPRDRNPPLVVMKFDPHVLARRRPRALLHRLRPFFEGIVMGAAALTGWNFVGPTMMREAFGSLPS